MSTPRLLSCIPAEPPQIPAPVHDAADGEVVRGVWRNALGGVTYQLGEGSDRRFAKWSPRLPTTAQSPELTAPVIDLALEADRLRWAGTYLSVPRVLTLEDFPDGQLMLTAGLPGQNSVSEVGQADPARAAQAVGRGLRQLHEALPVAQCPYRWDVQTRTGSLDKTQRAELLARTPDVDLVVCHGDPCAPNTLIGPRYEVTGWVDLGQLGVGDRWADLAVAAWSIEWNFGLGFEHEVYAGYGINPDPRKITFYRELWDAT